MNDYALTNSSADIDYYGLSINVIC